MEKIKNKFSANPSKLLKLLLIILLTGLFTAVFCVRENVSAQSLPMFVITEIMYDVDGTDTGREWIEVQNIGSGSIDLTTWKFFEANVAHKISAFAAGGDASGAVAFVPAGSFAIIADNPEKFLADHVGFSGLLFDSVFSLTNTGEAIAMRNPDGVDTDTVSYLPDWGANGDGLSLQKSSAGKWISTTPTPGSMTTATESLVIVAVSDDSGGGSDGGSSGSSSGSSGASSGSADSDYSAHSSQSVANTKADTVELEVTSGRSRIGFVGSPMEFVAKVNKVKNSTSTVEHLWSFGDGESRYGQMVSHTYDFPGEYIVILNSNTRGAEAVSKVSVKILPHQTRISDVGAGYVELTNYGEHEANIGGIFVHTNGARFAISKDTLLSPGKSIRISTKKSRFEPMRDFILIADPSGRVIDSRTITETTISLPIGMDIDLLRRRLETALSASALLSN